MRRKKLKNLNKRRGRPIMGPMKDPKRIRNRNRRLAREEKALVAMATRTTALPAKSIEESKIFLEKEFLVATAQFASPDALWLDLTRRQNNYVLIRNSKASYVRAISYIYALYISIMEAKAKDRLISSLCSQLKVKPTKKMNVIALIARAVIDYGEHEPHDVVSRRSSWSRDAKAIEYLIEQGIAPQDVAKFHEKTGGGVNSWSRNMPNEAAIRDFSKDRSDEEGDISTPKIDDGDNGCSDSRTIQNHNDIGVGKKADKVGQDIDGDESKSLDQHRSQARQIETFESRLKSEFKSLGKKNGDKLVVIVILDKNSPSGIKIDEIRTQLPGFQFKRK